MARYIDADKLKRILIDSKSFFPVAVKSAIDITPTEDVISRSEVEELQNQAKQEVASKIIREIRDAIFAHGTKYAMKELAKIEKEYIGEKENGKGN